MTYTWPSPPFDIVLVDPRIPGNTGNIARLCAGTGTSLHLAGNLGFEITDAQLKRAGLDYWDAVVQFQHKTFEDYARNRDPKSIRLFSTKGTKLYTDATYRPGDALVFGSETEGLSEAIRRAYPEQVYRVPMLEDHVRSLNLANTAALVLYEALRQTNR